MCYKYLLIKYMNLSTKSMIIVVYNMRRKTQELITCKKNMTWSLLSKKSEYFKNCVIEDEPIFNSTIDQEKYNVVGSKKL